MTQSAQKIKDNIIQTALPDVVFDGWTMTLMAGAAAKAGYERHSIKALFPRGMSDVLAHYADMNDRAMLDILANRNVMEMRIRDRILEAVMTRIDIVNSYRDAEIQAMAYWAAPSYSLRGLRGARVLWRMADRIWIWAGDTATDYNHYTKRTLLSGVIASSLLYWASDEKPDEQAMRGFIGRRIENVMQLGGILGKIKKAS